MSGVVDAAKAHDVNVVYFVGGKPVPVAAPEAGSRSYGLYDLIKPGQFDGILLAADIGHTSSEDVKNFCRIFAPTPIASFAVQAEGVSAFISDNENGMRAVIRHLIETHGYRRIAFLRGKMGQIEADLRFKAYEAELKAHNIPLDEALIVEGDFSAESGRAAARILLDERALKGLRPQAIAASNDRMAFGAMEVLQQRGIQVPETIALTGFDDISEAQTIGVPLTTVHQSFYEAGKLALGALFQRMNGEKVEAVNVLPAPLVVRWSCGCLPETITRAEAPLREVAQTGRLENKRDAAIRALFGAAGIPENDPLKAQYRDVFGRLWDVFLSNMQEKGKTDAFLKMTQAVVETLQRNGLETAAWQNVISMLRKYALGGISGEANMLRAENLFQQARMLVGELSQRAQAFRRMQMEQQEETLGAFGFSMAPAMSFEEIGEAISKHFPALNVERWYVMFYSDVSAPGSISSPTPNSYRLLLQYEKNKFEIPQEKSAIATGRLIPRGKTPEDHRYTALVMPLSLASNRFGFMWVEMGPPDWDVYLRLKNLLSSALLRTMLVQQREQAQKEIERLLSEARERAVELARARDEAEKTAAQNARLFASEQIRRHAVELLARSSRNLSSLTAVERLPQQILEQLKQIMPYDCGVLFEEDVNNEPRIRSHIGMPDNADMDTFELKINNADFYRAVARKGEILLVADVSRAAGWRQPDWLPPQRSWLGVPLYSKDKVIGLLALGRTRHSFNEDDSLLATTFAMQATVALENARLYEELTGFNQMMERMVSQRVDELNSAYNTLSKHDKNKSDFIQVAAHELRTPLTVIKGYLGMLQAAPAIKENEGLAQAIEGVLQGTNRLHQIVNSMLDVARLDSQVINPHMEAVSVGLIVRLVHKDYVKDLEARQLNFVIDDSLKDLPPALADSELLKKALDHVIVNAIKFTPDGGTITVSSGVGEDARAGKYVELRVKDTGIGIDAEHHKIIFEKLYQLGKVELHSSSRTNYKGGGAGLGLAIAQGIIKAMHGSIWVESVGRDETNFPGSTFFIRLPIVK
ncbi:MAG: hypothetical protein Fur002_18410 [Anaerolineales bacterium]